jgi:hypothetical protein
MNKTISQVRPVGAGPSIMVRLTVPRFSGATAMVVHAALGTSDLASLFARGRVGTSAKDPLHEAFDVELEADTGVGAETKLGLIELMNDGGMLRLTVPGVWAPVLARIAERVDTVELRGRRHARGWFTPRPGAQVEIPIPIGATPRRLCVGIAP